MSKMTPREALIKALNEKLIGNDYREVKAALLPLVEKSEPKFVVYETVFGVKVPTCPNCHGGVFGPNDFNTKIMYSGKHCSHCGQALEWEETK